VSTSVPTTVAATMSTTSITASSTRFFVRAFTQLTGAPRRAFQASAHHVTPRKTATKSSAP